MQESYAVVQQQHEGEQPHVIRLLHLAFVTLAKVY